MAQLEEIDELGYKWDGIKLMKNKFSPKYCKFKDKDGKHVPVKEYAERAAEYLRDVQWKKVDSAPPQTANKKSFPSTKDKIKNEPFHLEEMNYIINKLKNNKAPGPDKLCAELVKLLDIDNRRSLLNSFRMYNRQ